ncbi:SEC-C domain-containing protein [Burkholderia multivorans]|uniref:YecA family protein n=1 Tax=Burkholderia multivorans TaxID=87883 RepID=UPI0009E0CD8F|nr:SEC-C metal-binding domain-containing protein [Burkholderia multivorans]MCA8503724.1 SEC-C domain-containing protein [Burkholderia multivorans]MDN8082587.1 SEC-C metal-binding domain-containing protein [Burkholderia multivorans]SAK29163.1 YecA family protein [Burkholderia multivorans]SAK33569.1 YecA family protein [Burkholderia multivorans]
MAFQDIPRRATKIGRNDPCPCGSGKKYKKCHESIDQEASRVPLGMIDARARKLSPPRKCMVPSALVHECAKGTINAHTISRSGSLKAIVRDGKVYSYKFTLQNIDKGNGRMIPELTGWRDASTFPGFCSHHDKAMFAPLEDVPFQRTKEQCFLLAYRAIARELYTKQGSQLQSQLRAALATQRPFQESVSDFNFGVDLGLRDASRHKDRYDKVLLSRNWGEVHAVLISFDGVFPIQCAGAFFPEQDVNGKVIQELGFGKKSPDAMSVVSFAADNRSYLSFCWLSDSNESCAAYMSALQQLPVDGLHAVLAAVLLQVSENCHFSPDWYEGLSADGKKWVADQMSSGLPFAPIGVPARSGGLEYFPGLSVASIETIA